MQTLRMLSANGRRYSSELRSLRIDRPGRGCGAFLWFYFFLVSMFQKMGRRSSVCFTELQVTLLCLPTYYGKNDCLPFCCSARPYHKSRQWSFVVFIIVQTDNIVWTWRTLVSYTLFSLASTSLGLKVSSSFLAKLLVFDTGTLSSSCCFRMKKILTTFFNWLINYYMPTIWALYTVARHVLVLDWRGFPVTRAGAIEVANQVTYPWSNQGHYRSNIVDVQYLVCRCETCYSCQ